MKFTLNTTSDVKQQVLTGEECFTATLSLEVDGYETFSCGCKTQDSEKETTRIALYRFFDKLDEQKLYNAVTPEKLIALAEGLLPMLKEFGFIPKKESGLTLEFIGGNLVVLKPGGYIAVQGSTVIKLLIVVLRDHLSLTAEILPILKTFLAQQSTASRTFTFEF